MLACTHRKRNAWCVQNKNIQSLGGKARAAKLSAEELSAQASKAASARWPVQAIRKGNFREEFGIDVDCYVLDDAQKTAVISQSGMARALGFSSQAGGTRFTSFLATKAMAQLVGPELMGKLTQPVKFQWGTGGTEQPPSIGNGFDVTLLIDLCRVIIEAEGQGLLGKRHARISAQAHVILNASAKSGIKGLVYALAGYNPSAEEVIAAFKHYVQEEAKKYEKEFPSELYAEWYRLYEIPVLERGKPWHFKHLTVRHVYSPLAKSNGKILQLLQAVKANGGDRQKKLFQFLNEVGTRALRFHLGRVLEMAESSDTKAEYEKKILRRFGGEEQQEFALTIPDPPSA